MKRIILLLFFTGCGVSDLALFGQQQRVTKTTAPAQYEQYSYSLQSNDCITGKHMDQTLKGICELLKNDVLNNNCAKEERERLYQNSGCVETVGKF